MIKNLVFDFGNVLVKHDLRPLLQRHFGEKGSQMASFLSILSNQDFTDTCDRGVLSFDEMLNLAIQKHPEFRDAFLFFRDNYIDEITGEVAGMREVLLRLKSEGYRLYGLTNWSETIYKVLEKYEIFRLLDGLVISCEEHFIKPEKEIYIRLCEKYNLNPAECIFTDDKAVNIEGARAIGMKGVLFTDSEQYLSDIRNIIDHGSDTSLLRS